MTSPVTYVDTAAATCGSCGSGATVATHRAVVSVVRAPHRPITEATAPNAARATRTAATTLRTASSWEARRCRVSSAAQLHHFGAQALEFLGPGRRPACWDGHARERICAGPNENDRDDL